MSETQIARRVYFSSGHKYYSPKFSDEKNKELFGSCFSEHGHGHNYILEAYFSGQIDKDTGMIIDLREIDSILKEVVTPMDHSFLNTDVEFFKNYIPTTENIALYCWQSLSEQLKKKPSVNLRRVRIYESEDLWADYYGDGRP